ncbi:MAG TPA: peptidylprolyl isomerase [Actinomycetota bacterium]|jgi:cyclophilin family peptidyl-prolyl cis-trans isomerase|nr:peptidylprolyl isomerase [Actinomycetota bacterium]
MSTGRSQKRARKKEARDARREAIQQYRKRRRRQRLVLLASSLALIAAGVIIVLLVQNPQEAKPEASPSDDASAQKAPTPEPVACGADLPSAAGTEKLSYGRAEDQTLDKDKRNVLTLETSCGDIQIELDVENSPSTANSVAYLARQKFYDGLVFHRVVPGFVIQGGDPKGDGSGGAGYSIVEPPPKGFKYEEGVVAMAKAGTDPPGSSSSQLFIVTEFGPDARALAAEYAVLGKVIEGMDVVEKIEKLGRPGQDAPMEYAYIERATVTED